MIKYTIKKSKIIYIIDFLYIFMRLRRCWIEIVKEILELLTKKDMSKTEIIKRSNLNFNKGLEVLNYLENNGLIIRFNDKYSITEKGLKLVNLLLHIDEEYLIS